MSLQLDYRPAQPHGWPGAMRRDPNSTPAVGKTLGGNESSADFVHSGRSYRIETLTPHPVYRDWPSQAFKDAATKAPFTYTYHGGLPGNGKFSVQSCSVYVSPEQPGSLLEYGLDVYVVYGGDHGGRGVLRWIQVVNGSLDNLGRANPFYFTGGRTSIFGRSVFNFSYLGRPTRLPMPGDPNPLADRVEAEIFLVRDTGTIIQILGGLSYGWRVSETIGR